MNFRKAISTRPTVLILILIALVAGCARTAEQRQGGVERMYVLYCGEGNAADSSRWAPGVAAYVNKPFRLTNSCYLIKHAKGWMLWETGYAEALASMKDGFPTPVIHWRWTDPKTLTQQLTELGVAPGDIKYVGFSHAHPDHIGNGGLFPNATLYIQEAEYDFYLGPKGKPPAAPANFEGLRKNTAVKLKGDYDVFGDGSVTIISSPGHTPGHQSLMVKLPQTGPVLLTGDAVHFRDNWDTPRAPAQNFDREATIKSVEKLHAVVAANKAQVWINHDPAQTATLRKSPAYYE